MKKAVVCCIIAISLLLNTDGNVFGGAEIAKASSISTYKTTANINMRKGASIKSSRILVVPKGKKVIYISKKRTKNGTWYKMKYKNKKGWLNGQYIKVVKTIKSVKHENTPNAAKVKTTKENIAIHPLIIAHRGGANHLASEHSLLAYKQAVDKKADYIEIDLRLTKDNQLIAMHDETVDRTTNGTGKVSDYTLQQLKQLSLSDGQKIPSLEEIFARFRKTTKYYIETRKVDGKTVMEDELLKLVHQYGLEKQVIIQSYSQDSLKRVKSLDPNISLILLLVGDTVKNVNINAVKQYAIGVGPYAQLIDKSFVDRMHQANLKVHAWFDHSNEKELIHKTLQYGVDGVFTDYLADTQKMIKK
ncbi:glycerophosphodiester phosphodiesterase family protein [Rummeliibacillus sp. SL167]|uniref:glycerophosphodiester phosphodiesterase family protein n=1 Tax=Rummeliibacillus sp. SL167 TaxID=2579792 RepID=UPI0011B5C5B5|nr:glycerophosphodiester phosphodiesterase family protein [Rummeliibacillus sp. SL167]